MRITAHNLYQRGVVSFMECGFKVADGHNGLFCSRNLTFNRLSKSVICRLTDTEFCLHTHVALSFQLSVNGILRPFGSLCMISQFRREILLVYVHLFVHVSLATIFNISVILLQFLVVIDGAQFSILECCLTDLP